MIGNGVISDTDRNDQDIQLSKEDERTLVRVVKKLCQLEENISECLKRIVSKRT